jgi:hypothetical protein
MGGGALTDPTFDPPGRRYTFGWGSRSRKLTGPAVAFRQGRRAIEREFEQAPADIGPRLQWLPIGASTTIGSARRSLDLAARCQDARSRPCEASRQDLPSKRPLRYRGTAGYVA